MTCCLASGAENVRFWSLGQSPLETIEDHDALVSDLCWLPTGQKLASCDIKGSRVLVSSWSDNGIGDVAQLAAQQGQTCVSAVRSVSHVLTGGLDQTVHLWSIADSNLERTFKGHGAGVSSVSCSAKDSFVVAAFDGGKAMVHSLTTTQPPSLVNLPNTQTINRVRFSSFHENLFAAACGNGTVNVWNVAAGELHTSFGHHQTVSSVTDIAFSPKNENLMASVSLDQQLNFYDVPKKKHLRTFRTEAALHSVVILHDGCTIVAGSSTGEILVYDLRSGATCKERIEAHSSAVRVLSSRPSSTQSVGSRPSGATKKASISSVSSQARLSKASGNTSAGTPSLHQASRHPKQNTPVKNLLTSQHPFSHTSQSQSLTASEPTKTASLPSNSIVTNVATVPTSNLIIKPVGSVSQLTADQLHIPLTSVFCQPNTTGIARTMSAPLAALHQPMMTKSVAIATPTTVTSIARGGSSKPAVAPAVVAVRQLDSGDIFSPLKTSVPSVNPVQLSHSILSPLSSVPVIAPVVKPVLGPSQPSVSPLVGSGLPQTTSPPRSLPLAPGLLAKGEVTRVGPTGHPGSGEDIPRRPVGMEQLPGHSLMCKADSSGVFSPAHSSLTGGQRTAVSSFPGLSAVGMSRHITGASQSTPSNLSSCYGQLGQSPFSSSPSPMTMAMSQPSQTSVVATEASSDVTLSANEETPPGDRSSLEEGDGAGAAAHAPLQSDTLQPLPFHTAAVQKMIRQAVDDLRMNFHSHLRSLHVDIIRQFEAQTAEFEAMQLHQNLLIESLLVELHKLREENRQLSNRY